MLLVNMAMRAGVVLLLALQAAPLYGSALLGMLVSRLRTLQCENICSVILVQFQPHTLSSG